MIRPEKDQGLGWLYGAIATIVVILIVLIYTIGYNKGYHEGYTEGLFYSESHKK